MGERRPQSVQLAPRLRSARSRCVLVDEFYEALRGPSAQRAFATDTEQIGLNARHQRLHCAHQGVVRTGAGDIASAISVVIPIAGAQEARALQGYERKVGVQKLFKDVGQALPWITRLVLDFSQALTQYGWILLLVLVGSVAAGWFYLRTPEGKTEWDRLSLRIWLLGDLVRKFETARFARTLSALLRGGVPLLEALGTVQGVVGNRLLTRAIGQVQIRVREGKGMARPLGESGLFPPLALNMIAVGEETGKLEAMLNEVAEHYDQEVKRTTKRLTAILEPALILGMGLIIGVVVVSMLLAIFSMNDLPF